MPRSLSIPLRNATEANERTYLRKNLITKQSQTPVIE